MPSVSKKQHNLMAMVANNPTKAKQLGIPQSVGKEFTEADKGKKFGTGGRPDLQKVNKPTTEHGKQTLFKGGGMAKDKMDMAQDKKMVKKAVAMHDKQMHGGKKTDMSSLKKGGMAMKKMAMGGMARMAAKGEHPVQKQAKRGAEMVKMAAGGLASGHKSADGCAVRGKTRGTQAAMRKGGKVC
jgi:hypothetical protein